MTLIYSMKIAFVTCCETLADQLEHEKSDMYVTESRSYVYVFYAYNKIGLLEIVYGTQHTGKMNDIVLFSRSLKLRICFLFQEAKIIPSIPPTKRSRVQRSTSKKNKTILFAFAERLEVLCSIIFVSYALLLSFFSILKFLCFCKTVHKQVALIFIA